MDYKLIPLAIGRAFNGLVLFVLCWTTISYLTYSWCAIFEELIQVGFTLVVLLVGIFPGYLIYSHRFNYYFTETHLILKNSKISRNINPKNIKNQTQTNDKMRILGYTKYRFEIKFENESSETEVISFYSASDSKNLYNFESLIG